jgi:hypothetical protein
MGNPLIDVERDGEIGTRSVRPGLQEVEIQMRKFLKALTEKRGYNADGRTLGLGLALAMEKQRQDATRGVEEYLRTAQPERKVGSTV